MQPPQELHLEIKIYCEAPGGASTGASAAVGVVLIGALEKLAITLKQPIRTISPNGSSVRSYGATTTDLNGSTS